MIHIKQHRKKLLYFYFRIYIYICVYYSMEYKYIYIYIIKLYIYYIYYNILYWPFSFPIKRALELTVMIKLNTKAPSPNPPFVITRHHNGARQHNFHGKVRPLRGHCWSAQNPVMGGRAPISVLEWTEFNVPYSNNAVDQPLFFRHPFQTTDERARVRNAATNAKHQAVGYDEFCERRCKRSEHDTTSLYQEKLVIY